MIAADISEPLTDQEITRRIEEIRAKDKLNSNREFKRNLVCGLSMAVAIVSASAAHALKLPESVVWILAAFFVLASLIGFILWNSPSDPSLEESNFRTRNAALTPNQVVELTDLADRCPEVARLVRDWHERGLEPRNTHMGRFRTLVDEWERKQALKGIADKAAVTGDMS